MIAVFFFYGLAFFSLGLAVYLEARQASQIPLRKELPWLAAFGLIHGAVEWIDMFLLMDSTSAGVAEALGIARMGLLPLSALLLVRFGIGLIREAGPLPEWLALVPFVLLVPAALLIAYAVVVMAIESPLELATDVWSRYLLYFPGNLLAAFGFVRQWRGLSRAGFREARHLLLGAALVFLFNALVAGLIVPTAPYGLAPWLNYSRMLSLTGVPVQIWRMLSAVAVTVFVIQALGVFEAEREQRLKTLQVQRQQMLETVQESEERFRTIFELAPMGMDIIDITGKPIQANQALQQMLGYSNDEFKQMVFTDYTYPDDVDESRRLVQEIIEGERNRFKLKKRYYRKDGTLVWGNVTVSGIRDANDELRYFIAMVEDITERKQAEEALQAERERAQEAKLEAQMEARRSAEEWTNNLVDISRRIAHMESVDALLLDISRRAQKLLGSDVVSIGLLAESEAHLELKCQATAKRAYLLEPSVKINHEPLLQMLQSHRSYRFPEDVDSSEANWHCPTLAKEIRAAAVTPLQFDDQVIGGMWIARFSLNSFTPTDLIGLESLADQAVIAIQHALMASRLQSVAALEERSRIAREMHDGLAQILGYLGLQMQTLQALVQQGERDKILAELEQTRQNIKLAQADVRENILSLRTTLAGEAGLIPALREYVEEFGLQTGTKAQLIDEVGGRPTLSPLAEVQLVRIIQEALANVRKHAQAQQVQIQLCRDNGYLSVAVIDDGIGFASSAEKRRFGLQTMQERAKSVNGRLTINSNPGEGTQIKLWLPLLKE